MRVFTRFTICPIIAALAALAVSADAATLTQQLGEQDFTDGQLVTFATADLAGRGEDPPFDEGVIGADGFGLSFTTQVAFTHTVDLNGGTPLSAELTMGIWDIDSFLTTLPTLQIRFDGVLQDDSVWTNFLALDRTAYVRTMDVDPDLLTDGALRVAIRGFTPNVNLQRGNHIAMDFSRLTVEVSDPDPDDPDDPDLPPAVPLPANGWLLLGALAFLGRLRSRFSAT